MYATASCLPRRDLSPAMFSFTDLRPMTTPSARVQRLLIVLFSDPQVGSLAVVILRLQSCPTLFIVGNIVNRNAKVFFYCVSFLLHTCDTDVTDLAIFSASKNGSNTLHT